jgi:type I restriction enzyme S subunit
MQLTRTKLNKVAEITSSKRIYMSDYTNYGIPFYRSKEIIDLFNHSEIQDTLYISEQKYEVIKSRFGVPQKGDLLFTSVGTIGIPYLVRDNEKFYFKDGNLTWFRRFSPEVKPEFLFYLFQSPSIKKRIINYSKGTSQSAITIETLKEIELDFPPIRYQEKIADILSSYDGLIDTNRRRIQLLEESVRLLFREWFVYFRFPGYEKEKIVDGVPAGWERGKVKDLGVIVTGKTPSKKNINNFDGAIPFIKTPDMHQSSIIINTEESLSEIGASSQKNKYLPSWSILVSCIGTVGVVAMNLLRAQTNQQINSVIPKKDIYRYYSFFCLSRLKPLLEAIGGGSTMANVNKNKFENLEALIPSQNILNEFHEAVDPIFKQVALVFQQNQKLAQARDLLLPRLMSGEIEV